MGAADVGPLTGVPNDAPDQKEVIIQWLSSTESVTPKSVLSVHIQWRVQWETSV